MQKRGVPVILSLLTHDCQDRRDKPMKIDRAPPQSTIKKVEVIRERRRIVFHISEDKIAAYGQTAGGWGRVEEPEKLALRLLAPVDLRFDHKLDFNR